MRQIGKPGLCGVELSLTELRKLSLFRGWENVRAKRATESRVTARIKQLLADRDDWAADPCGARPSERAIAERFAGRFPWLEKELAKTRPPDILGTVESLNRLELRSGLPVGSEVDIDAYLRGESLCLGEWERKEAEHGERVLRLAVGCGANSGTSTAALARQCALALSVARSYEEAGYSVEVLAFYSALEGFRDNKVVAVVINCAGATMGQISSVIGSTMVFRLFAMRAMAFVEHWTFDEGYGYPINHNQNQDKIQIVNKLLWDTYGSELAIIHGGATEKQVKLAWTKERKST